MSLEDKYVELMCEKGLNNLMPRISSSLRFNNENYKILSHNVCGNSATIDDVVREVLRTKNLVGVVRKYDERIPNLDYILHPTNDQLELIRRKSESFSNVDNYG